MELSAGGVDRRPDCFIQMLQFKLFVAAAFVTAALIACSKPAAPPRTVVAENKGYGASLFRQNCAICHGLEGDGKTLSDGTVVPSLRSSEPKFRSEADIRKQISDGGNGMLPFRLQLTDREIDQLVDFVHNQLRQPN